MGVSTSQRYPPAENTNNLMSVAPTDSIQAATTDFLNDATVLQAKKVNVLEIPEGLKKASQYGYSDDLTSFFEKPVNLSKFSWAAQAAGDTLATIYLPSDGITNNVYKNKLSGFLGFKATARVTIQVNANPFQAGRLILVFVPQAGISNTYPGQRIRSLMAATQLPNVELDLAVSTEITMDIPYISPTPYYNLITGEAPHGKAYLLVYSPLAVGTGSSTVTGSVWVSFTNVELVGPTYNAQAGKPKRSPDWRGFPGSQEDYDDNDSPLYKEKKNITERELAASGEKPISSGLSTASKIVGSFAAIPMLSAVAAPASWVLNALSGAASAFGYSKPSSETTITKVLPVRQFFMQNHNGIDVAPNMALDATNKLTLLPGFAGTDTDEMNLNHLLSIPAFYQSYSWNTSDAAGIQLLTIYPEPHIFKTTGVSGFPAAIWSYADMIPLTYFSNFFSFWRGSIVINIKLVKTAYHSGRLMLTYAPGSTSAVSAVNSVYCMREIIDVRETSEYSFVLPYVSTKQYHKMAPGMTTSVGTQVDPLGYFGIMVLNELVCPDTAASGIKILIEVSGGEDFEVMFPRSIKAAPYIDSGWAAQSDAPPATIEQGVTQGMGPSAIQKADLHAAQYCVGEKCNSILQLLKRYSYLRRTTDNTVNVTSPDIRPFSTSFMQYTDAAITTKMTGDTLSLLQPCFAYTTGGIRIGVSQINSGTSYKNLTATLYPAGTTTADFQDTTIGLSPGASVSILSGSENATPFVQVPPYQQLHSRLSRVTGTALDEPLDQYSSSVRLNFCWSPTTTSKQVLMRAASDDYVLGYFLGVPRIIDMSAYY